MRGRGRAHARGGEAEADRRTPALEIKEDSLSRTERPSQHTAGAAPQSRSSLHGRRLPPPSARPATPLPYSPLPSIRVRVDGSPTRLHTSCIVSLTTLSVPLDSVAAAPRPPCLTRLG
jgi:hypothetical protein